MGITKKIIKRVLGPATVTRSKRPVKTSTPLRSTVRRAKARPQQTLTRQPRKPITRSPNPPRRRPNPPRRPGLPVRPTPTRPAPPRRDVPRKPQVGDRLIGKRRRRTVQ